MALLDDILLQRRGHKHFDEELWDFVDAVQKPRLVNLSDDELQVRLAQLERNIAYLDSGSSPRDDLPPERGWISPWWWLRLRRWTLLEMERRGLAPLPPTLLASTAPVSVAFRGDMNGGTRILTRISKKAWLLDTLTKGVLRFAPAASYDDAALNVARADDEMGKSYKRPGDHITIAMEDGKAIPVLGDAVFTMRRQIERGADLEPTPYWLTSFSTELDPRLFADFASDEPDEDACLVIFDFDRFVLQALPALNAAAPLAVKSLVQNDYFDPYHPPQGPLSAITHKDMRYASQREARFVLDPEDGPALASGPLFVSIGSIEDYAAVYGQDGLRIAGSGPDNFWA